MSSEELLGETSAILDRSAHSGQPPLLGLVVDVLTG